LQITTKQAIALMTIDGLSVIEQLMSMKTSVQSNLAKSRIAVLSILMATNAFVCCMRWTGTFAHGGT